MLQQLGMTVPVIQAPMAGVSTPAMAAAVSNAGGLGSVAIGAVGVDAARQMIRDTRALTDRAFNVNVFCHAPARRDTVREQAWLTRMAAIFADYGATPPDALREIYPSFHSNRAMLDLLLAERPAVVSFHFGLPRAAAIAALKQAGVVLLATATNRDEAQAIAQAGLDAVVAQGWEAGGHRGMFDPDAPDARLNTLDLLRDLAGLPVPVIAAGGIMTGADVARAVQTGAVAAQMGTAFLACPESAADAGYRAALGGETVMTRVISGRPARCVRNHFTDWGAGVTAGDVPDYPCTYDAGKALNTAAQAKGEAGFGAQWSGIGGAQARAMGAGALVRALAAEITAAQDQPLA